MAELDEKASKKRGERPVPPGIIPAAIVVLGVVAWFLFPSPFARGLVVGLTLGPLALIGVVVYVSRKMRRRLSDVLQPPPLPVTRWDYDFAAEDLDGEPLRFEELRGRVVILNFWATTCGPCVAEMPSLDRLRGRISDVDVALACLTPEPADKVSAFLEKRGIELPVLRYDGKVPDLFSVRAIPATIILDKNGSIAFRHVGAAAWDDDGVVDFIRGLAQAPAL